MRRTILVFALAALMATTLALSGGSALATNTNLADSYTGCPSTAGSHTTAVTLA